MSKKSFCVKQKYLSDNDICLVASNFISHRKLRLIYRKRILTFCELSSSSIKGAIRALAFLSAPTLNNLHIHSVNGVSPKG